MPTTAERCTGQNAASDSPIKIGALAVKQLKHFRSCLRFTRRDLCAYFVSMGSRVASLVGLDDDAILCIFQNVFIWGGRLDGLYFVSTCRRLWDIFGPSGIGARCYQNYKASFSTRVMGLDGNLEEKVCGELFLHQRNRELATLDTINAVHNADLNQALHCAHDCCLQHRLEFNSKKKNKCIVYPAAKSVRLIVSTRDFKGGDDIYFLYHTERTPKRSTEVSVMHVITKWRRAIAAATGVVGAVGAVGAAWERVGRLNLSAMTNVVFEHLVDMNCSPDGRSMGLQILTHGQSCQVECLVWNTTDTDFPLWPIRLDQTLRCKWMGTMYSEETADRTVVYNWWATDIHGNHHHLIAWKTIFRQDGSLFGMLNGFAVSDHTQGVDSPVLLLNAPCSNLNSATYGQWRLLTYRQYVDGKMSPIIYDLEGVPFGDRVKTWSVSCTTNPVAIIGQASRELFFNPVSACISPSGDKLAILSTWCEHQCSQRPVDTDDRSHLLLTLFTRSPDSYFYYRQFGARDEVHLPIYPRLQRTNGWFLDFTPCGSIIQVVYCAHLYVTPEAAAHPTVYFCRLAPRGISRSKPIMNTKVKQITWLGSNALISLKHGAVLMELVNSKGR